MARPADPVPVATSGRGCLVIATSDRGAIVTRALATSPLKWLTPKTSAPSAWVFASSYGGGLVDGDALEIDVTVEADACALVSTQASTKIYPSSSATRVDVSASVARGATLVNLPDPVVCYAGARYRQHQAFNVDEAGALVSLDWMTSGRLAYGERWKFEQYVAETVVRVGGRRVVHDVLRLCQSDGRLEPRLGRFDVLALLVIVGQRLAGPVQDVLAQVSGIAPERRAAVLVSAAPVANGAVVRLAGMHVEHVRSVIRDLLGFVPALLGDDPWARKW